MINEYRIRESTFGGIPFSEIWGATLIYEDLYELIGKEQFMATYTFWPESESFKEYGESVTGVMFIAKEEIPEIEQAIQTKTSSGKGKVKIDSPMPDLTQAQREELRYGGINLADIGHLTFHYYKKPIEYYETGEKKVPNIITIPFEDDGKTDYDILFQNLIVMKINSKTEIIPYEKEKFLGITLGINNGRIDSRLLKFLGFDDEKIQASDELWYHVYKTKERRKTITEEEKVKLADLKVLRLTSNFIKLMNEIKESHVDSAELSKNKESIQTIVASIKDFEPHILLHGKRPIYWDLKSYLHVVLRHAKKLQMGTFKSKSPFPYRLEDLETLIEKVLGQIEGEIQRHFSERPGNKFRRSGRMCVPFNGDYYCLYIDENGKLETIYAR